MPALAVTPLTTHNIMQISVCVPVLQPADQLANIHRVFTPVCNTTPTPTSGYLPLPPSVAAWAWAGVFTFNSLARKNKTKKTTQFCNLSQPSYFCRLSLGAKHETRHLFFFSPPLSSLTSLSFICSAVRPLTLRSAPAGTGPRRGRARCDADTQQSVKPKHPARLIRRDPSLISEPSELSDDRERTAPVKTATAGELNQGRLEIWDSFEIQIYDS